MDKGTQSMMTLMRLPHGGYIVCDGRKPEHWIAQHFACTTFDEAVAFLRHCMEPVGPEPALADEG